MELLDNIATKGQRLHFCPLAEDEAADKGKRELNQFLEWRSLSRLHPETYALKQLDWLITGTLTWKDEARRYNTNKSQQLRNYDFNLLMLKTADLSNNRLKDIATISTDEFHITGEVHQHFLIGNFGIKNISPNKLSELMQNLWERELHAFDSDLHGIGSAVIKPYDYDNFGQSGVDYFGKVQFDLDYKKLDKEFYYSKGFWRMFEKQSRERWYLN